MLITVIKRLAFTALLAIVIAQPPQINAGSDVPFKSRVAGQQTSRTFLMAPDYVQYPQLGFPLNTTFVRVTTTAIGNGSGVGKYTFDTVYDVQFAVVDGLLSFVSDGSAVLTSANGDKTFSTFTLLRTVGQDAFRGTWEVSGGTGRFVDASGAGTTIGTIFPDPSGLDLFSYEDSGSMSSVGSHLRNK